MLQLHPLVMLQVLDDLKDLAFAQIGRRYKDWKIIDVSPQLYKISLGLSVIALSEQAL